MRSTAVHVALVSLAVFAGALQARAAPFGTSDRAAWVAAAGGEPDLFFHFDESAAGSNSVPDSTSVGDNTSPIFLVDFHAALGVEFLPFAGTSVLPGILRNQTFQIPNSTGQDGHDPGRARDALIGNFPSPNPISNLQGRAVRLRFLTPVRSFGVRVNTGDGGVVDAFDVQNNLILQQPLPSGGFAGIVSDVPIDHVHIVNTFDADILFGLYDFQYHSVPQAVPVLPPYAAALFALLLAGLAVRRHRAKR